MNIVDGQDIRRSTRFACDIAIVGSGPAGATAAMVLSEAGLDVIVVEAGRFFAPAAYPADSLSAMSLMYRNGGAQVTRSTPTIPLVQGVAVGGTSVINGAISWRLPRDVWAEWLQADRGLEATLGWEELSAALDLVEADLGISPTDPAIAGRNNQLLARAAAEIGLEHRPIRRNVSSCLGLGRCLQGCPERRKASMDQSYLPRACRAGARILSSVRVQGVEHRRGRATGLVGRSARGATVRITASLGVIVAASALQTPALLWRSGLRDGAVGENFQAHPGVAVAGRFADPVTVWTGATQGHEVIGLRREGIKFEALGFGRGVAVGRLDGVGSELQRRVEQAAHWAHWGAAVRASARGRVRPSRFGGVAVDYRLSQSDTRKIRRGVAVLGEMLFAAGAEVISPKVHGWRSPEPSRKAWGGFEESGPLSASHYTPVITHMFGTARMGSDPATSVVRPDFLLLQRPPLCGRLERLSLQHRRKSADLDLRDRDAVCERSSPRRQLKTSEADRVFKISSLFSQARRAC